MSIFERNDSVCHDLYLCPLDDGWMTPLLFLSPRALIRLLQDCVASETAAVKFVEIVMKVGGQVEIVMKVE